MVHRITLKKISDGRSMEILYSFGVDDLYTHVCLNCLRLSVTAYIASNASGKAHEITGVDILQPRQVALTDT